MRAATCPTCKAAATSETGVLRCSCGTILRVRKNGDIGYQIESWRPKRAGRTVVNGKVKSNGR